MSETTLLPVTSEIEVGGRTLTIKEVKTKQLVQILPHLQVVRDGVKIDSNGNVDLLAILSVAGEAVIDILSIACNQPRAFIEDLDINETLSLAGTVFAVNKSFFTQLALASKK